MQRFWDRSLLCLLIFFCHEQLGDKRETRHEERERRNQKIGDCEQDCTDNDDDPECTAGVHRPVTHLEAESISRA